MKYLIKPQIQESIPKSALHKYNSLNIVIKIHTSTTTDGPSNPVLLKDGFKSHAPSIHQWKTN